MSRQLTDVISFSLEAEKENMEFKFRRQGGNTVPNRACSICDVTLRSAFLIPRQVEICGIA